MTRPPQAIARNCDPDRARTPPTSSIRHAVERLICNGSLRVTKSMITCTAIVALHIPRTIEVVIGGFSQLRVITQRHSASTKSAPRSWRQSARCVADSLITERCVCRKRTRNTSPDPMRYAIPKYLRVEEQLPEKYQLQHLHEAHNRWPNNDNHQERKDAEHRWEDHFHRDGGRSRLCCLPPVTTRCLCLLA